MELSGRNQNQSKKSSDNKVVLFLFLCIALLCVSIGINVRNAGLISKGSGAVKGWNEDKMRKFANKLKADNLNIQAVNAFEEYLSKADTDIKTRSNIYYSLGDMLLQNKDYENALSYFYKAEIANPDSDLKQEIGSSIVTCLENMGRGLDAEYQLESRATLGSEEKTKKASGEVVAKIGKRQITMGEINSAIENLPQWMKDEYSKDETKKLEFLKQYVSNELLHEKGVKLGYNRDPKIREQVSAMSKQFVVQKVIEKEVYDKIKSDSDDLKNYYEVNKKKYDQPEGVRIKHILCKTKEEAEKLKTKINDDKDFVKLAKENSLDTSTSDSGGVVSAWITANESVPGKNYEESFRKELLALPQGNKVNIVGSNQGYHLVKVTDKRKQVSKTFDDVKNIVSSDYQREKGDVLVRKLITDTLKSKNVEIYENKFKVKPE